MSDNENQRTGASDSNRRPLSQFLFAPKDGSDDSETPVHEGGPHPIPIVQRQTKILSSPESSVTHSSQISHFSKNRVQRIDYPLYDTEAEPNEPLEGFSDELSEEVADVSVILDKNGIYSQNSTDFNTPLRSTSPLSSASARSKDTPPRIAVGAPFPLDDFSDGAPSLFRRYLELIQEKRARLSLRRPQNFNAEGGEFQTAQNRLNAQSIQITKNGDSDEFLARLPEGARDSFCQFLRALRVE